ncbi:MAG: DUF4838 domain-containing protein [Lentisphaeria bacterium]|nr:DUF4838 domain-containing protein [Lentisphaeria bacterium]
MKQVLFTILFFAVFCGDISARERFIKSELPPRVIHIDESQELTIPRKSADLEIVVAKNALPITKFAAEELKTHLEKALDTVIPIVNDVTPEKISFLIGVNEFSRQAGLDDKKLTRDSFMIRRDGRKIYILGTDAPLVEEVAGKNKGAPVSVEAALKGGVWRQKTAKGTLFGVYDFLERFAGVRFFFANELGVIVPKDRDLKLPGIDIFDRADCDIRISGFYKGVWEDIPPEKIKNPYGDYITPQRNLSAWRWRFETAYTPCMHGLGWLDLEKRFGETHPEYFALRSDGKRHKEKGMHFIPHICYASGVSDEIFKDMQALAAGEPPSSRGIKRKAWMQTSFQDGYFAISLQDALYPCHCEKCWPHLEKEDAQARSNYIWDFDTKLAKRAKEAKLPLIITTFAYHYTIPVPDCEIPDNMHVQVCVQGPPNAWKKGGAWGGLDQMPLIRAWHDKVPYHDISLYNYTDKFDTMHYDRIPNLAPRAFGKFYSEAGPYVNGAYAESETDDYLFNYLTNYILGKLMWNNSCDWQALLKDHYRAMFGPAADTMEKIYEELEDVWINRIKGNVVYTSLGPKNVCLSEYEVWTEIYTPERLADLGKRYDLAEQQAADDPECLARVKYIRKHYLDGMLKQSKAYLEANKQFEPIPAPLKELAEGGRITVDGKLDEPGWKSAAKLKLQALNREVNGSYPDTFVRVTEDKENLYVAFECREPDHTILEKTPVRKHDDLEIWSDNTLEVFLNPAGEKAKYYQILINSAGSMSDLEAEIIGASSFISTAWESGVNFAIGDTPGVWFLEIAVPKKNIPGIDSGNFRANFCRTRPAAPMEHSVWGSFLKKFDDVKNFGMLVRGMKDENLLRDGDFSMESEPAPINSDFIGRGAWSWAVKNPEGSVSFDEDSFVTGTRSLKLKLTKADCVFAQNIVMNLKPDTKYRLSFYMKTEDVIAAKSSHGACVRVSMTDADGKTYNDFYPVQGIIGTKGWFRQTFDLKTSSSPVRIAYIAPSLIESSGTVWFDDVRLEELKEEKAAETAE